MKTNNTKTLATLGTQDTGWKQTIERHCQHWAHKIQDEDKQSRDTVNTGHRRYRMNTNNRVTLSTLGTQDTGWRQTIQRYWQHWAHKIQDEDKQSRDTVNTGHIRYRMKTNNRETLSTLGTQDTGWKQTIEWNCQHWPHRIQDEDKQSRDTVNTGHTRYRMKTNNRETLSTPGTQDTVWKQTIERHCQHWAQKIQDEDKQSRDTLNTGHTRYRKKTNNPERLSTLGTQDTGWRHNPETLSTLGTQDTGRRQTIQRHWQHWAHKIQDENKQSRDTVNTGNTRHRMKTNNLETLSTLGTQDTGRRQTIQRHWQHWAHKIQDESKQSRDTVNTGHTRHRMKANNLETLSTLGTQDTGWKQTI